MAAGTAILIAVVVAASVAIVAWRQSTRSEAGPSSTDGRPTTRPAATSAEAVLQSRLRSLATDMERMPERPAAAPPRAGSAEPPTRGIPQPDARFRAARALQPDRDRIAPWDESNLNQLPDIWTPPPRSDDTSVDLTRLFPSDPTDTRLDGTVADPSADRASWFAAGSSLDELRSPSTAQSTGSHPTDTSSGFVDHGVDNGRIGAAWGGTGPLAALPPASSPHEVSIRERIRKHLGGVTAPQVLALSVLDSAGRSLAGATDKDIVDELLALVAESGRGVAADVVQPVRLADEAIGALLILPTGADALLGALVQDQNDLQDTRVYLRTVASAIGDILRTAA